MNYELTMLQNAKKFKQTANQLQKLAVKLAMGSFATIGTDDTYEQAQRVATTIVQRDNLVEMHKAVQQGLGKIPECYRKLLKHIYFVGTSKKSIAEKHNVALSTVYRKVNDALKCFREQLALLGYDEAWFNNHCSQITVLSFKRKYKSK